LIVLSVVVLVQCQTRPQLSTFFESNILIEVQLKKENTTIRGDGYWMMDQPKGLGIENFYFHNRSHRHDVVDVFRLQRYDLGYMFQMDSDRKTCNKTAVSGNMPNEWQWVANATFQGRKHYRNRNFDLWQFTAGYATISLLVDESDPNTPVFLGRETPEFNFIMEFAHYKPNHPASKWFDVPKECQSSKILIHSENVECVQRNSMINSAQAWVNAKVPYNQDATYGGYREDCSGYVSMCWEASKPGYTTETLPQIAHAISRADLQPGDVLLCTSEHVVLFGGWVDSDNYIGYEETQPGQGTIKSSVPYPFWYNTACFQPYRFNSVC